MKPKFTYHHQQQQFLDSLSSQQKNTSYIFSYPNFLCSSLIRENFKNGVQAFGYHTEFGQGLESFLQDGLVRRRFDPRQLLQQQQQQRQSAENAHRQGLQPEPQVGFPHEIHRRRQRGGAKPPRTRHEDQGREETHQRQRSRRSPRAHQRELLESYGE